MDRRRSGAFSYETLGSGHPGLNGGTDFSGKVILNAHDSNTIYQDSATVTPLSQSTLMLMKY